MFHFQKIKEKVGAPNMKTYFFFDWKPKYNIMY